MTALPRRQQNRLDRERRILDAALKVFSRSGYSGASMDTVATEAGLSKPTLYQYFRLERGAVPGDDAGQARPDADAPSTTRRVRAWCAICTALPGITPIP